MLVFIVKRQNNRQNNMVFLLLKDRKKKNEKMTANAQNNTFASPDTKANASQSQKSLHFANPQTDR